MILYDYYRSSAAYRVRISLNLKAIDYQQRAINLLNNEQTTVQHQQRNHQKLVPVLEDDGIQLTQSLAICEYLDEAYPNSHQLVYGSALQRAKIRAFSQAIACETHPLNNLRTLHYLADEIGVNEQQKTEWYQHWITTTFSALETQLNKERAEKASDENYCLTDKASLADICLIPQIYNAQRVAVDMQKYPILNRINQHCLSLTAFAQAHPDAQ